MLWSAGLNLFRDVLKFGQMLILVRLLDPAIYGMAGLAATVINFIGLISFQHFITHVLQVRGEGGVNYHLHFTVGLVINSALFILTNLIAVGLQYSAQYAVLQPLLHVLSLTFLLSVPTDMRVKMLERDHNWSRLRLLQMSGIVVSIAAAIVMALAGAGVYALIVPSLLASLVFVVDLFVHQGWRPRWQWNYTDYREALHFGLNRAGSNALNGGRQLLQNTLITQHLQFSALGVFGRAEGLANQFCSRIAQEASNALYPVITRAEARTERFQRISGLVLQSVAWVVIPIAAFFSLEADNIVRLLFGKKWIEVVPLLPLVMVIGFSISIGSTAYRLLLANDQSRLCLRSDVAAFVLAAATMLLLIPNGLFPYLIGSATVHMAIAGILITLLVHTRAIRAVSLVVVMIPPVLAAFAGAVSVWLLDALLPENLLPLVKLLIAGPVFVAGYLVVLRMLFRAPLAELVSFLPGARHLGRLMYL
jgi:O-antigen/teichoic acid export membrane protein